MIFRKQSDEILAQYIISSYIGLYIMSHPLFKLAINFKTIIISKLKGKAQLQCKLCILLLGLKDDYLKDI